MPKNCNCAGATCGCRVIGGTGIVVDGVGTASNPFRVTRDITTDTIKPLVGVDGTTSVEMRIQGEGTRAEPLVISSQVVLVSPNNMRWRLQVSNSGQLSAVAI